MEKRARAPGVDRSTGAVVGSIVTLFVVAETLSRQDEVMRTVEVCALLVVHCVAD